PHGRRAHAPAASGRLAAPLCEAVAEDAAVPAADPARPALPRTPPGFGTIRRSEPREHPARGGDEYSEETS
ncbi:hypothetical protein RKE29_26715, partial [Streptomyces sp. B1866]|uniref:hypothetical protein n=1 Tax=Streptomyces sp. B1866 TaxID=3075431 RepID=UPI00289113DE